MKRLLVLAGIFLALITTTNQADAHVNCTACKAPILVSN